MPINFPDSPTTGNVYTIGDKTWTYDGTAWNVVTSSGSDHGNLGGLADDDHTQYALADGSRGTFETSGAVSTHEAAADPHTQYLLADGTRTATDLTVSGDMTVDTTTLHVDSTNNRVGVGTTSPNYPLHVNGKVIVGGGDNQTPDASGNGHLMIDGAGYTGFNSLDGTAMWVGHNSGSRNLHLATDETARVTVSGGGNVGINDSTPSYNLDVNGTGRFTGTVEFEGGSTNLKGSGNYPNSINFYHPTTGFWHNSGPRLLEGNRISWYWNNGSTYTETMSMYPSGHMVKPLQPAFFAYLSGSNPTYGSGWTSLVHNAVVFNVGGTYSTSTKRFTCPTAGRWLFIVTVNYYNFDAGSRFIVHMDKNGGGFSRVWDSNRYTTTTQDNSFTASVIMDLAVGNYVYPSFYSATDTSWQMSAGSLYNSFQGYFLG